MIVLVIYQSLGVAAKLKELSLLWARIVLKESFEEAIEATWPKLHLHTTWVHRVIELVFGTYTLGKP